MCGILCALQLIGSPQETRRMMLRQSKLLRHRGPDSTSIWQNETGSHVICFERLNIIDPSESGRQAPSRLASLSDLQAVERFQGSRTWATMVPVGTLRQSSSLQHQTGVTLSIQPPLLQHSSAILLGLILSNASNRPISMSAGNRLSYRGLRATSYGHCKSPYVWLA